MPKRKRKTEGTPEPAAATPETAADFEADDTELIAVIAAAIAAAREAESPAPVITAVREAEPSVSATGAVRAPDIPAAATGAAREEETRNPSDSFTARTIKRRGRRR